MSFASPSDFLARFDARTVGDLVEDLGVNVPTATLLSDANLQAALDDASGDIVAACIPNQRYATQDLITLAGSGLPSAFLLKRINCVLALAHLLGRRVYNGDETDNRIPSFGWANDYLEKLRNGIRVFELPALDQTAGVMTTTPLGSNIPPRGLVGHNRNIYGTTDVNINDPPFGGFSTFGGGS